VATLGPPQWAGDVRPLSRQEEQDLDIQRLSDQYQEQLADLNAAHSLLTVDQQRLADMLYVDSSGGVTGMLNEDVRLFKEGLDFRLKEFEESCNRIQDIERRLQEKIDEATTDYEHAVHGVAMSTDSRIMKRLREQQRLIELQQREIDQVRFEKVVLEEETKRLRDMTMSGQVAAVQAARAARGHASSAGHGGGRNPSLHVQREAMRPAPPVLGGNRVVFADQRGGCLLSGTR
jgi:hypothetical protein